MNDDAKFFFFLSGFIGFWFFYSISIILNRDPIMSLIHGSLGSLFFSLLGRALLISALKKVQLSIGVSSESTENKPQTSTNTTSQDKDKNQSIINSSLTANKEAASSKSANLRSLSARK